MLNVSDLTFRRGDRLLFDAASLHIPAGRKVGFVGRNGAGKSTLIKLIMGEIPLEAGSAELKPRARLGHVAQEVPGDDRALIDIVLDSHTEMRALEAEAETATEANRIAEIHTRLADIEAHTAPARAATILSGLGFDDAAQQRPASSYSGGWRMRVALAATLFLEPDLLLLDEPTNYLDLEGVLWLEAYLRRYPHTVLLISHDRDLLNKAVTHIAHLSDGKITQYTGGYDDFEEARRERLERQMAMVAKQEAQRRHLEAFVERFRAKASKAKQAQSRVKMLEKMKPIVSVTESDTIPFRFPKPDPLSSPLILLEDAAVGYGDSTILSKLNLRIDMDDRIALLGANGNGKSTFAKLMAGRLKAQTGHVRKPRKLISGYFAQHQLDELPARATPYHVLRDYMPEDATEAQVRARLGGFGFGADKADRAIESLSGGEKARLMFALATFDKPQILILDEPTNHLDVDSREALVQAINEFDGAVILISHDRHLVHACVDRLWLVADGGVKPFDGDLDDYAKLLLADRGNRNSDNKSTTGDHGADQRKAKRANAAEQRAIIAPLRQRVAQAEAFLDKATMAQEKLEAALADPALYEPEKAKKLADISAKANRAKELVSKAEEDWLMAQDALDAALAEQEKQ